MTSQCFLLLLISLLALPTVTTMAATSVASNQSDTLSAISLIITHNTDLPSEEEFNYTLGAVFNDSWETFGGESFERPQDVTLDSSGNLYVTESSGNRIHKLAPDGRLLLSWGSSGAGAGQLNAPSGIVIGNNGLIYVVERNNHRVQQFDPDGQSLTMWGSRGSAPGQFESPEGIAVDLAGNLYVADTGNHRIQKFDADGTILALWGQEGVGLVQFDTPFDVAVDDQGNIYVAEWANHRIQVLDSTGAYRARWGGFGMEPGQLRGPMSIAVSEGKVYVADTNNQRIQKFEMDGRLLAHWGRFGIRDGEFSTPTGVAVDQEGQVYVVDRDNQRIQRFEQPSFALARGEQMSFSGLPPGSFTIYAAPQAGWGLGSVSCNVGSPEMSRYGAHLALFRDEQVECVFVHHALVHSNYFSFEAGSPADPNTGIVYTLRIRAFIDGRSQLIIQGNTAYWHHDDGAAPGRHRSIPGGNAPTTLNSAAWYPVWPGDPANHPPANPVNNEVRDCDCDSINQYKGVPVLAATPQTVEWFGIQAREDVVILQQPAANNDYTLIVEFDDNLTPGPTWYEIGLDYLIAAD